MSNLTLALVVPVYNEEESIQECVNLWTNEALKHREIDDFKIIVINDGSTDKTSDILKRLEQENSHLLVINKENEGHGKAILTGYKIALELKAEWIFQADSDNEIPVEEFVKLWSKRKEADFILGYRIKRNIAFSRKIISYLARNLILFLYGVKVRDPNVPFRLLKREELEYLLSIIPHTVFAPNIFISATMAYLKKDILYIPVMYNKRQKGKVSIVGKKLFFACLRSLKELILFKSVLYEEKKS